MWLTVVLLALATHRLTRLVVTDHLLDAPRAKVQNWAEERCMEKRDPKNPVPDPEKWTSQLAYLLSCPWCVSFWVATLLVVITAPFAYVPLPLLTVLGCSSVTGLLSSWEGE